MNLMFIETLNFTRAISNLLSDDDYVSLQRALVQMPDLGTIIVGSGGIRKFRWAAKVTAKAAEPE